MDAAAPHGRSEAHPADVALVLHIADLGDVDQVGRVVVAAELGHALARLEGALEGVPLLRGDLRDHDQPAVEPDLHPRHVRSHGRLLHIGRTRRAPRRRCRDG